MFTQKEWQIIAGLMDNTDIHGTLKTGLPEGLHEILMVRQKVQAIIEGNITLVQKETPPDETVEEDDAFG